MEQEPKPRCEDAWFLYDEWLTYTQCLVGNDTRGSSISHALFTTCVYIGSELFSTWKPRYIEVIIHRIYNRLLFKLYFIQRHDFIEIWTHIQYLLNRIPVSVLSNRNTSIDWHAFASNLVCRLFFKWIIIISIAKL